MDIGRVRHRLIRPVRCHRGSRLGRDRPCSLWRCPVFRRRHHHYRSWRPPAGPSAGGATGPGRLTQNRRADRAVVCSGQLRTVRILDDTGKPNQTRISRTGETERRLWPVRYVRSFYCEISSIGLAPEAPVAVVRIGWSPRSHSHRGGVEAATLGTAAEKMGVIMARPVSAEVRGPNRG